MTEPSAGSPSKGITISFTKQQTLEGTLSFGVHGRVDLEGHQVE